MNDAGELSFITHFVDRVQIRARSMPFVIAPYRRAPTRLQSRVCGMHVKGRESGSI
jgi:hypothetical protein